MGQWVNGHNLVLSIKVFFYNGYSFYIQLIPPLVKMAAILADNIFRHIFMNEKFCIDKFTY